MTDIQQELESEEAINIIMNNIAILTGKYSVEKDTEQSNILMEKLNILNKIKDEIYLGNIKIIKNVIEKNKKGTL